MNEDIGTILEEDSDDFTLLEGSNSHNKYDVTWTDEKLEIPTKYTLLEEPSKEPGVYNSSLGKRTIAGTLAAVAISSVFAASTDSSPPKPTSNHTPTTLPQSVDPTLVARHLVHSIDLGLSKESEATAKFIESHMESIEAMSKMYGVPVRALEMLISREVGYDSENGAFGVINKLDEQRLKAWINYNRAVHGIEVDKVLIQNEDGMEEEYILGPSLSWLNIKPGLVTRAVIDAIKDLHLKQRLLETYDDEQHHAGTEELARILDEDFENSLHIVSAVMSYWVETISKVEFVGIDRIQEMAFRNFLLSTVSLNYYPDAKKDILYYDPKTGLLFGQYPVLKFDESEWPDLRDRPVKEYVEKVPNKRNDY